MIRNGKLRIIKANGIAPASTAARQRNRRIPNLLRPSAKAQNKNGIHRGAETRYVKTMAIDHCLARINGSIDRHSTRARKRPASVSERVDGQAGQHLHVAGRGWR